MCEFWLDDVFAKCEFIRMKLAYTNTAIKALSKMNRSTRDRIVAKIEAYAAAPQAFAKVKTLQGRDGMRLRVGDWRVIFTVEADTMTVRIVGHRSEIYD